VGKTSLARAATYDRTRVYVDLREFEWRHYVAWDDFYAALRTALPRSKKALDLLSRISGVSVAGFTVEFARGRGRSLLPEVLRSLDEWAAAESKRLVVAIDEAQELYKLKGGSFTPVLAWAYDNLDNVVFLLTGSKVGLMHRLLRLDDPESPLYGRYVHVIKLHPLPREKASEFLARGFAESGIAHSPRLLEATVDHLDGIIGRLSYLGLEATRAGRLTEELLKEVAERATRLAWGEFCNFVKLRGTARYLHIVHVAAEGATWSEVKRYLEIKEGPINDAELNRLLKSLVEEGWLEKGEVYRLTDPLMRYAAKNGWRC
jgi:Predicted ATPase (AAA+ superfamily)